MKITLLLFILLPGSLLAQINQAFDGCNRLQLQNTCWEFSAFDVSSNDRIGSTLCSARSGTLTSATVTPAPNVFMNTRIGTTPVGSTVTISFDYKFTNNTSTPNLIVFIENMDGTTIPILNVGYTSASVQSFSGTVVTTKLYFKFRFAGTGLGGSSRVIIDNVLAGSNGTGNITFPQTTGSSATCSTAFPVRLTQFEGKSLENAIELKWKTAWELENKMFEIYRSTDALSFEKIAEMAPTPSKSYTYLDKYPIENQYYYKLHQIDLGGQVNTSKIIAVKSDKLDGSILFPNPAYDEIKHHFDDLQEYSIFDSNGKEVLFESLPIDKKILIKNLLPGMYVLKLKLKGGLKTFKFHKY